MKADKDSPNPRIYQAKATHAVIGGNHVGADMLALIVIDKYRYHLCPNTARSSSMLTSD